MNRFSVLIVSLLFTLSLNSAFAQADKRNITVTGHRGAAALSPENTMLSVQKAISLGVHRVEIDVHQSKDGEIVIMHDHTLNRTTNGKGKIKKYTYEELQKFEIDNSIERISTLQDAIDLCKDKVILVIELKKRHGYYNGIEEKVVKLIQENNFKKQCIIHAFDTKVLKTIHALDPEIELHKLVLIGLLTNFKKFDYVSEFSVYNKFVKQRHIKKIHALNKKANVWTVNDKDEVAKLVAWGVDGIITDDPRVILNRLKQQ